ncbi:MAG TPA: RNA polymerase sigma factor [Candidatus Dormibacteraeota bacterium]|jgi:RNA polymerase sigma-70 factor (ECF subfamily)
MSGVAVVLGRVAPDAEFSSEALARAATGGDDSAFEALIRRFQRRVHGFAYQHLRDPDEAQDLAQEVFVRLYRALDRYDGERPFEPWFWKLAANVSLNYMRKRVDSPSPLCGEGRGGAEPWSQSEDLREALSELDPANRMALLLHYYSGLSLAEVAAALHLGLPALKSRMHRSRAALRRALVEAAP